MERLTMEEIIAHCNRVLDKIPSGTKNYQEHESTRAYLQELRHYQKLGTRDQIAALKQAERLKGKCHGCESSANCNYCIRLVFPREDYYRPSKASLAAMEEKTHE